MLLESIRKDMIIEIKNSIVKKSSEYEKEFIKEEFLRLETIDRKIKTVNREINEILKAGYSEGNILIEKFIKEKELYNEINKYVAKYEVSLNTIIKSYKV